MGKEIKIVATSKSIPGLRDMLFDELDNFRRGRSTINRARTIVNFSREIIDTVRLEIINSALVIEKRAGDAKMPKV